MSHEDWVTALTSEEFAERKAATTQLALLQDAAMLHRLAADEDPEVSHRARQILQVRALHVPLDATQERIDQIEDALQLDVEERYELIAAWLNESDDNTAAAISILASSIIAPDKEEVSALEDLREEVLWSLFESEEQQALVLKVNYHARAAAWLLAGWTRVEDPRAQAICEKLLTCTDEQATLAHLHGMVFREAAPFLLAAAKRHLTEERWAEASQILQIPSSSPDQDVTLLRHLAVLHTLRPKLPPPALGDGFHAQSYLVLQAQLGGDEADIRRALKAANAVPDDDALRIAALIQLGDWAALLDLPVNAIGGSPTVNHHVRAFLAEHVDSEHDDDALAALAQANANPNPHASMVAAISRHDLANAVKYAKRCYDFEGEIRLLIDAGDAAAAEKRLEAALARKSNGSPIFDRISYLRARYADTPAADRPRLSEELGESIDADSLSSRMPYLRLMVEWGQYGDFQIECLRLTRPGEPLVPLIEQAFANHPVGSGVTFIASQHARRVNTPDGILSSTTLLIAGLRNAEHALPILRSASAHLADDASARAAFVHLCSQPGLTADHLERLFATLDLSPLSDAQMSRITTTVGDRAATHLLREWRRRANAAPTAVLPLIRQAHLIRDTEPAVADELLKRAQLLALAAPTELTHLLVGHQQSGNEEEAASVARQILSCTDVASTIRLRATHILGHTALREVAPDRAHQHFIAQQLTTLVTGGAFTDLARYTRAAATLAETSGLLALGEDDLERAEYWLGGADALRPMRANLATAIYRHLHETGQHGQANAFHAERLEKLTSHHEALPDHHKHQAALDHWRQLRHR